MTGKLRRDALHFSDALGHGGDQRGRLIHRGAHPCNLRAVGVRNDAFQIGLADDDFVFTECSFNAGGLDS